MLEEKKKNPWREARLTSSRANSTPWRPLPAKLMAMDFRGRRSHGRARLLCSVQPLSLDSGTHTTVASIR